MKRFVCCILLVCSLTLHSRVIVELDGGELPLGGAVSVTWENAYESSEILNVSYDCGCSRVDVGSGFIAMEFQHLGDSGEVVRNVYVDTVGGNYTIRVKMMQTGGFVDAGLLEAKDGEIAIQDGFDAIELPTWLGTSHRSGVLKVAEGVGSAWGEIRWKRGGTLYQAVVTHRDGLLFPSIARRGFVRTDTDFSVTFLYGGGDIDEDTLKVSGSFASKVVASGKRLNLFLNSGSVVGVIETNVILQINGKTYDIPVMFTVI